MKATLTIRHHAGTLTLETEAGAPVAPLLREAGLLYLPCGVGKCGKCLIYADTEPCAEERALLGERTASGLRLACHTRAADGLEIRIPRPEALRVLTGFAQSGYPFRPIVERRAFAVEAPSLVDQRSDLQRLMDACAVDRHALDLQALAALPAFLRGEAAACGERFIHQNSAFPRGEAAACGERLAPRNSALPRAEAPQHSPFPHAEAPGEADGGAQGVPRPDAGATPQYGAPRNHETPAGEAGERLPHDAVFCASKADSAVCCVENQEAAAAHDAVSCVSQADGEVSCARERKGDQGAVSCASRPEADLYAVSCVLRETREKAGQGALSCVTAQEPEEGEVACVASPEAAHCEVSCAEGRAADKGAVSCAGNQEATPDAVSCVAGQEAGHEALSCASGPKDGQGEVSCASGPKAAQGEVSCVTDGEAGGCALSCASGRDIPPSEGAGRICGFGLVHGGELVGYTASETSHALIVDIGTTTVAALLVDLRGREVVAVRGERNAQSPYGADVISRIRHETAWRESGAHGQNPLRAAIVGQIASLLRGLLDEAGIADVDALSITGNTTMMHLFCGLPAEGIGKAPFIPASLAPLRLPAAALGLPSRGTAFLMPGISSYIGADIVASLLAAEAHRDQPPFLLVDLGTNAETVLGAGGGLYACSAAAGPCFEGATLSCGMAGQEGAIDAVFPDARTGLSLTTIGDAPARGLCGSGVLDAVALLLDAGALDETGRLEAQGPLAGRIRDDALVLADGVRLTQKDIREVQLAKAAVRAGIDVLLQEAGLAAPDVACLYLAGGFGSAIRPASASRIGLIPPELAGRVRVLGNAAGCGALRYVTEEGAAQSALSIIRRTRYVELSAHPGFTAAYVDRMCFPEAGGEE